MQRKPGSLTDRKYCLAIDATIGGAAEKTPPQRWRLEIGAPDTIRTCDFYLRRVALYPSELRAPCAVRVYHRVSHWANRKTSTYHVN